MNGAENIQSHLCGLIESGSYLNIASIRADTCSKMSGWVQDINEWCYNQV